MVSVPCQAHEAAPVVPNTPCTVTLAQGSTASLEWDTAFCTRWLYRIARGIFNIHRAPMISMVSNPKRSPPQITSASCQLYARRCITCQTTVVTVAGIESCHKPDDACAASLARSLKVASDTRQAQRLDGGRHGHKRVVGCCLERMAMPSWTDNGALAAGAWGQKFATVFVRRIDKDCQMASNLDHAANESHLKEKGP